jgi:superfamily II DNA or RNA helicase
MEHPPAAQIEATDFVFACLPTVADAVRRESSLPSRDLVIVDECHHVGPLMYRSILTQMDAGADDGPFLLGLTATPWRADDHEIEQYFGDPLISIDLVTGLKNGFLTNVDYRMYTDNIDWNALRNLSGDRLSPRAVNRTLFIPQWDDGVVTELQRAWEEQARPRAIVFCGTIEHALLMRDRINARGFCAAAALYSVGQARERITPYQRNRILADFQDGLINVVCAVDVLNEGVDVPDANIIVFQRVTHSRRIFVQQLGRGLRLAADKDKVIVLDFVSDIRRFAAGLELRDKLATAKGVVHVKLPSQVRFVRLGSDDPRTESFLREWLHDIAAVEAAGEDAAILRYPPALPGGRA